MPAKTEFATLVKLAKADDDESHIDWPHPCSPQDVRALVLALAVLEKLRKAKRQWPREYLQRRREFLFGIVAALETDAHARFSDSEDRPHRRREPKRKARS